jgi:hypothetical protein
MQYILKVIFPRKHGRIIMRHGATRQENCGWSGVRSGTRITTFAIHGEPTTRMSESFDGLATASIFCRCLTRVSPEISF